MRCPFCKEYIKDAYSTEISHYDTCSGNTRKLLRKKIDELPASDPYVATYHKSMEKIAKRRDTCASGAVITILRMWRANELLKRVDYHSQLRYLIETDDHGEFSDGDDKNLDPRLAANPLLDLMEGRFRVARVEEEHNSEETRHESLQVVLAFDDFFRKSGSYIIDGDFPPIADTVYTVAQHRWFTQRANLKGQKSLSLIIEDLEADLAASLCPQAVANGILNQQIASQPNGRETWDDHHDTELLCLLGKGLSIVDCTRMLNAFCLTEQVAMRTRKNVEERVMHLLGRV